MFKNKCMLKYYSGLGEESCLNGDSYTFYN